MGWLFYDTAPTSIPEKIREICTGADAERSLAPIFMARVGSVWSVAVKVRFASPALAQANPLARHFTLGADDALDRGPEYSPDPSYVFAAVILTERGGDGSWGYKDMDETMGPVEASAPLALLDLLSPTTHGYALDWRQRCRKAGNRRADEAWRVGVW